MLPTYDQVSAGGVVFRSVGNHVQVALIAVGPHRRWQLPKGTVMTGETPEATAVREVREETGLNARLVRPLDTIEYWYTGELDGQRVRFRKHVHFFLMTYLSGDVADHDHEAEEARWITVESAVRALAFKGERGVLEQAVQLYEPGA